MLTPVECCLLTQPFGRLATVLVCHYCLNYLLELELFAIGTASAEWAGK
jgi:hypothetical protein